MTSEQETEEIEPKDLVKDFDHVNMDTKKIVGLTNFNNLNSELLDEFETEQVDFTQKKTEVKESVKAVLKSFAYEYPEENEKVSYSFEKVFKPLWQLRKTGFMDEVVTFYKPINKAFRLLFIRINYDDLSESKLVMIVAPEIRNLNH